MLDKVKVPRHTPTADQFIKDLEIRDGQYQIIDSDVKGLCIRVHPSGRKTWLFRYNVKIGNTWRGRAINLGTFKNSTNSSEGLTTSKARQQAAKYKFDLRHNNIDPLEEKERIANERLSSELALTINGLFDIWFKAEISQRKDGGNEAKRMMEKDVLPYIGSCPINDVKKIDVANIISIVKKRSERMSYAVFSLVRQMFTYAVERDFLEFDPTYGIKKSKVGSKGNIRERYLTDTEIVELFTLLPSSGLLPQYQLALKIQLGTCTRIGELSKAKWKNVDLVNRTWLIPESDSKNGRKHKIWLSDFLLTQFKRLHQLNGHTKWCFPNKSLTSHLSTRTISKHVVDRQKTADTRIKSRTQKFDSLKLTTEGDEQWRPHDLRRTGATIMVRIGVIGEVIERCLNHTEQNRLKKTYLQYDYWSEMKSAWNELGKILENIDCRC